MTTRLTCWCSCQEWSVCFRRKDFGLIRCAGCGSYRISPPALRGDSEAAEFYTAYYDAPVEPGNGSRAQATRHSRFWKVVAEVPQLAGVGERALDIGCGEGALCSELKRAGWASVVGADVSRSRVARARSLHPTIEFHDVPVQRADLEPASIDLAVMDNVIEHISEPVVHLRAVEQLLRPGGRLVLITPNMESGHFRLLGSRWTPELAPHVHLFLFTAAALSTLARTAGFEVEAAGAFHLDPYPLRRLLGRFLSGDVKGAIWKTVQESGSVYARLINAGPMLYVVARRPAGSKSECVARGSSAITV